MKSGMIQCKASLLMENLLISRLNMYCDHDLTQALTYLGFEFPVPVENGRCSRGLSTMKIAKKLNGCIHAH